MSKGIEVSRACVAGETQRKLDREERERERETKREGDRQTDRERQGTVRYSDWERVRSTREKNRVWCL